MINICSKIDFKFPPRSSRRASLMRKGQAQVVKKYRIVSAYMPIILRRRASEETMGIALFHPMWQGRKEWKVTSSPLNQTPLNSLTIKNQTAPMNLKRLRAATLHSTTPK